MIVVQVCLDDEWNGFQTELVKVELLADKLTELDASGAVAVLVKWW